MYAAGYTGLSAPPIIFFAAKKVSKVLLVHPIARTKLAFVKGFKLPSFFFSAGFPFSGFLLDFPRRSLILCRIVEQVSCIGTELVGSPGRVTSRKVGAVDFMEVSSLICGEAFFGVAFLEEDLGLGGEFFVEGVLVGAVVSSEGSSMVAGAGVGAEAAFLVLDADFVLGEPLAAVEGLSASASFVAGFAAVVFDLAFGIFAVEALDSAFEVEGLDRGLSPGLMAG